MHAPSHPAMLLLLSFSVLLAGTAASRILFECTSGWDLIGTHCYNFVNITMDFEDARNVCDKYGATLIEVRDEVEAQNVSSIAIKRFFSDQYWIYNGKVGQDMDKDSLKSTFCQGMWQPDEPRETNEDVAISSNMQGRWAVTWVWTNLPFVCRTPACPTGSFRCSDGTCLNIKWKCDGVFDCMDQSDESDCGDSFKYYRQSSGTIDTTILTNSDNYQWIIEGQPGEVLRVEFENVTIDDYADSVRVYTGGSSILTSELIQVMSSSLSKKVIVFSKNHFLIITLQSDATVFKPTIKANWKPDNEASWKQIEAVSATNTSTYISSPYFNSSLGPDSFKKEWLLTAPQGELITLEVVNTFGQNIGSDIYIITNAGFVLKELNSNKSIYISNKNSMSVIIKSNSGKRFFHAYLKIGCDFTTELSLATFSVMDLPVNLICFWKVMNALGTDFSLRIENVHFDDFHDFLQLYSGTDMKTDMIIDTVNHSNIVPKEFSSIPNGVSFKYFSDIVQPGIKIQGRITADCPKIKDSNVTIIYSRATDVGKAYDAQITCNTGFTFKQEEYSKNQILHAACNEGGQWDWGSPSYTRTPECQVVYCGFPQAIQNGYVSNITGSTTYNAVASYECFPGFHMLGKSNTTCLADGSWSVSPSCQASFCSVVPQVAHGNITIFGDLSQGTVIRFSCDPGYDLQGPQQIVCQANNIWSHSLPVCKELTCPLPKIKHGHYASSNNLPKYGDAVSLSCDPGYQINRTLSQSDTSIMCSVNRTLSPDNDFCVDTIFDFDVKLWYKLSHSKLPPSSDYDATICLNSQYSIIIQRVEDMSACGYDNFRATDVRRTTEISASIDEISFTLQLSDIGGNETALRQCASEMSSQAITLFGPTDPKTSSMSCYSPWTVIKSSQPAVVLKSFSCDTSSTLVTDSEKKYCCDHCEDKIDNCTSSCMEENLEQSCIDLETDYYCPCKSQFTGKNCSEDFNECSLIGPCIHGGTCTNFYGGYNCTCPPGWTGDNCELEEIYCSLDPCHNKGTCYNLLDQFYCKCQSGTSGPNCEKAENICEQFSDSICTINGKCELSGGTAKCQCLGETICTFYEFPTLQYSTDLNVVIVSSNGERECEELCLLNTICVAYLVESDTICFHYKTLLNGTVSNRFKSYVKKCTVKSNYSGSACELQKDHCADNPCNGGICTLSNLTYECNCDNVKNVQGVTCDKPKIMCEKCPQNMDCKTFLDQDGYLNFACMCEANATFMGNKCRTHDTDYDLAFLESFADKKTYVTSERGFYLDKNSSLSVTMWVAAARKLNNDSFILGLRSSRMKDYFLLIFNAKVQVLTNQSLFEDISLDFLSSNSLDESFIWHFISIAWSANGNLKIVLDFLDLPILVKDVPPSEEYVFVDLGQSFYGYISQVSIWKSPLTTADSYEIFRNKLALPQRNNLLLGWIPYSYDNSVQKTEKSTAAESFSICSIPGTIAKMGLNTPECKSNIFIDKSPPKFKFCNESVLIPTDYTMHQVSSGVLGYEYTDKPGELPKFPERQFFSYGAFDVAVTAADIEGNIGVCMTRVYITPNKCNDTEPSIYLTNCLGNSNDGNMTCPDGMMPSVPTPNFITCGKLQTYNLDNMYEMSDRIVCGVRKLRTTTVNMLLLYTIQVDCDKFVLSSFIAFISAQIRNLSKNWSGLCSDLNCNNVAVSANCTTLRDVNVNVQISGLREDLTSSMKLTLNPLELMKVSVAEDMVFDARRIAGAILDDNAQIDAVQYCDPGYGLTGLYCVQCGPGSYYLEGEMKCKLCEMNKYSDQSGNTICKDCPSNSVTFQRGSSSVYDCIEKCPLGQMFNITTEKCVPCPKNFYQDNEGKSYCFPCPPSSATENIGSKNITDCIAFCKPGTELKGQECVECQRGFYRPGDLLDSCTQCPLLNFTTRGNGSTSENECNIPMCAPGEFVQGSGIYTCEPCSYGSYQPDEAQFECLPCNMNFTTDIKGATNSSFCHFAVLPNITVDLSVVATVTVPDCLSPDAINAAIEQVVLQLIKNQNEKYNGLCTRDCASDVDIKITHNCGNSTRMKRQIGGIATVNVIVKNVNAILTRKSDKEARSSMAVLLEAFYDQYPVEQILATHQLVIDSIKALDCGQQCAVSRTGYPEFCFPGQFFGISMCESCPKGSYSTMPVSKYCITCPDGQTTETDGSHSIASCDGICATDSSYCEKGVCKRNTAGTHYCECDSDYTGPACNQHQTSG